ncbi:hypothetical protein RCL1_004275 [Eukaryota sp. TZLM3-RCL]
MTLKQQIDNKAIDLIKTNIEMVAASGGGHPSSGASLAHIITVLLYKVMHWDPKEPDLPSSDRLVLSEGHACPIVYAAAADLGVSIFKDKQRAPMTRDDAMSLRDLDSPIDGHPNPSVGFPFFPAATGSLGQGLSIACGLAAASRLNGFDRSIYTIIGDGESREGQIWEAIDFLVEHKLYNVCPIINANKWGQSELVAEQQTPEVLKRKLEAVGFHVALIDGHNADELVHAFQEFKQSQHRHVPFAVIAKTIKMWGCPSLYEENLHGKPLPDVATALAELEETRKSLASTKHALSFSAPKPDPRTHHPYTHQAIDFPRSLSELMSRMGKEIPVKVATRKVYGWTLKALGLADSNVCAGDGDVKNSTMTLEFAQEESLAPRYFECRIAEQHMISFAVGLAVEGKIPFVSSFGHFLSRTYDQIIMGIISEANVKIIASHVGVGPCSDGPSQMALSDIAWSSSFAHVKRRSDHRPAMITIQPCDAVSCFYLLKKAYEWDGAVYFRILRQDTTKVYEDNSSLFDLAKGFNVIREGREVAILGSGFMMSVIMEAVERLSEFGINPKVIDLYSLPFDDAALVKELGGYSVLTAEDNYGSSFGSMVASAVARYGTNTRVKQMCVAKVPKSSREVAESLEALRLDVNAVVNNLLDLKK